VDVTYSNLHVAVLEVLKDEGFIKSFTKEEQRKNVSSLKVQLKYFQDAGVIKTISRISKPGKRVYYSIEDLKVNKFCNGLGIVILSTPRGVISDKNAVHHNVGGEALCKVF
jgi:small subunit ribosomal protein S8